MVLDSCGVAGDKPNKTFAMRYAAVHVEFTYSRFSLPCAYVPTS